MGKNRVVLFGGTGRIGTEILNKLLIKKDTIVIPINRRYSTTSTSSIIKHDLKNLSHINIGANHVLICIGASIKKERDIVCYRKIDNELVFKIALWAEKNHIPHIHIISSIGAHIDASNFYLQMKGEMEQEVSKLTFRSITFYQPASIRNKALPKAQWTHIFLHPILRLCKYIKPLYPYQLVNSHQLSSFIISDLMKEKQGIFRYTGKQLNHPKKIDA
ncbi:hypothetical protein OAT16_09475 [Prolixibacteraceae bacterium]|nr:hypothetical protein [Prolixibacteraceae bacterium]